MELRSHPFMRYHGLENWPPVWTRARKDVVKRVTGEVGVLEYVHFNPNASSKCYLVMDYQGETYVSTMVFESPVCCKIVGGFLNHHLKKTLKEIGDLDLSHTL